MNKPSIFCILTTWIHLLLCLGCSSSNGERVAVSNLIGDELELVVSSEATYSVPATPNQLVVIESDEIIAAITIDSYSDLKASYRTKYYSIETGELIKDSGELYEGYSNYVKKNGTWVENWVSGNRFIDIAGSKIEWSAGSGAVSYFYFDKSFKVYIEKSYKKGADLFDRVTINGSRHK